MNIVYMGTPDFAVPSLQKLIESNHTVSAVFCQPDRPKNRGHKLTPPPVKVVAEENNIPVYQPDTLRDGEAYNILKEINPDVIVVAAYGKILPPEIIHLPPMGCVNLHGSILPKYRGAAPIQRAIINGDKETGVTVMQMGEGLDTGGILKIETIDITCGYTTEELFEKLSILAADMLVPTLEAMQRGEITPIKQNEDEATYAKMISKDMSPIDFSKSALEIRNQILGLNPWPTATTQLPNGEIMKIYRASVVENCEGEVGKPLNNMKNLIYVCGDGNGLLIEEVQLPGGKRMSGGDFLRGKGKNIFGF